MKKIVAILGAGAWGTAMAHLFAHNGHKVNLWCHETEVADNINQHHKNSLFLVNVTLPMSVYACTDINAALENVDLVIEAVPVTYLREVLSSIQDKKQTAALCWVLTSKGLEASTGNHSLDILYDLYGTSIKTVVVAGPSFATELVQKIPTVCMAATKNTEEFMLVQSLWQNDYCTLVYTADMQGLLLCGAVKNVVAILLGMLDGAGFGKNTQACILTYAFAELKRLMTAVKGEQSTVDGLGGFGDLFLTASTNISKNRTYGYLLGSQKTDAEIKKEMPVLPEGVGAAKGLHLFLQANNVTEQFPLLAGVKDVLANNIMVQQYVKSLFLSKP